MTPCPRKFVATLLRYAERGPRENHRVEVFMAMIEASLHHTRSIEECSMVGKMALDRFIAEILADAATPAKGGA